VDNTAVKVATISGRFITLELATDLAPDATPTVAYQPSDLTRAHDRVGIALADMEVQTKDKILPGEPTIDAVSGLGAQGGIFYTNDSTPAVRIEDVAAGHRIRVYRNGTLSELGNEVAQGSAVTVTLSDLGNVPGQVLIDVVAFDPSSNQGPTMTGTLELDFLSPSPLSAVIDGGSGEISVTLGEAIARGRDFADDWAVTGTGPNGRAVEIIVGEVTGEDATRTLVLGEEIGTTTITKVRFDYIGPLGQRYEDKAGNIVGDFVLIWDADQGMLVPPPPA
ncbi:MAG: hypothetical protein ACRDI3_05535, partial [Actinomycetota bacterium]